jgi:hypothetical protein
MEATRRGTVVRWLTIVLQSPLPLGTAVGHVLADLHGRPNSRAPDFDLVLSALELALLGQRRGQRSALLYLRVP